MSLFPKSWTDNKIILDQGLRDPESFVMTKKDFAEVAGIIKSMEHIPEEYRQQFALAFIHFFQSRNDRFNECKFIEACGFANLVDVKIAPVKVS